ncbi:MAG: hypothetical protein Q9201_000223 [Fulgogasparrea decipioides]
MEGPHAAAQSWSWRVPSPPRLIVPPPALNPQGKPELHIDQDINHNFESSGFANSNFLSKVTHGDYQIGNGMFDWKYEQRRTAQPILPFLFLGPITAARDSNFLRNNGITLLIAVRDTKSAHAKLLGSKAAQELGIPHSTVDTAGNQELIAAFPRGIEMINAHLSAMYQESQNISAFNRASTPGKVLVFCESGNERSAAMVVAYVMAMYSMNVIKAIQIVQAQRFAVAFDDSLKMLLQTYDAILHAKRDVLRSSRQSLDATVSPFPSAQGLSSMLRKPSKRTLDDHYDDGVDVDGNGNLIDEARLESRGGSAPFFDAAGP